MGAGSASKQGESTTIQPPLPMELQGQIGQRLREAYNELISEPVPDRFVQLLQQLKTREDEHPDQGQGSDT
jgi:anti-sigma factor NepR-like protein